MKITTLWIVTIPTDTSTLDDICFECDINALALEIRGGLNPHGVYGIYTGPFKAYDCAVALLAERDDVI